LLHLSPEGISTTTGSVMVKDETVCIRCGLCAERCPVHTITMEAFEVFDHDPNLVQIEEMLPHS
jgi:ferredoxin